MAKVTEAPPRDGSQGQARSSVPVYVYLLVASLLLQVFAGHSQLMGLPIGPDRLLLLVGLVLMITHPDLQRWRVAVKPIHLAMFAALMWCIASAVSAGTITDPVALFAVLDAFGVIPFLLFLIAPIAFSSPQRRAVLLKGLVGLGVYLGTTSLFEGSGLQQMVWPSYIVDPSVGLHFGRARGPFLQSAANGLALTFCCAGAAIALQIWRDKLARAVALLALTLSSAGIFLTLTRSVWIGALVGFSTAMLLDKRTRRWLALGLPTMAAVIFGTLAVSSAIRDAVVARLGNDRSGVDRINANAAALRILGDRPLQGVGWHRFALVEDEWVRQSDTLPITATGIAVHNVPLGYAAELGLPGAGLWICVVVLAVLAVRRNSRFEADLVLWRRGLVAVGLCWVIVAMLVPISYPFANSLIWLWLGLVADPSRIGVTRRHPGTCDVTAWPVALSSEGRH
jgi:putative inorganic carbon (hco3(-)) transporter